MTNVNKELATAQLKLRPFKAKGKFEGRPFKAKGRFEGRPFATNPTR